MLIQVTPDNIDPIQITAIGDGNEDSGPEDATAYTATFTVSEASFAKRNAGTRTTQSTAAKSTSIMKELIDEFIFTAKTTGQTSSAEKNYKIASALIGVLWIFFVLL
jgi:hypothetical protein